MDLNNIQIDDIKEKLLSLDRGLVLTMQIFYS